MMLKLTILAGIMATGTMASSCDRLVAAIRASNPALIKSEMAEVRDLVQADVNDKCVRDVTDALTSKYTGPDSELPANRDLSKKLGKVLKMHADNENPPVGRFKTMTPDQIKTYLHSGKPNIEAVVCSKLDKLNLQDLAADSSRAQVVRPSCFRHVKYFDAGKKGLTAFRDDILSMREGGLDQTWYKMNPVQLEKFQSNTDLKESRCRSGFHMDLLSPALFKAVPQDCFAHWLEENSYTLDPKRIKVLSVDHFKKCGEDAIINGVTRMFNGEWKAVHIDIINYLLAEPEYAGIVHSDAIRPLCKVNAEAFKHMNPQAQVKVMEIVKELPDNLFKDIYPAVVSSWDSSFVKNTKKQHYKDIRCFDLISDRKNAKSIMSSLKPYHCMDKSFADLSEAWTFGEFLSKECYKQLEVDADKLSEFANVHENVLQYISPALIKAAFKRDYIDHAQDYVKEKGKKNFVSVWRGVLRNPKVCRLLITQKTFKSLREHKLTSAMSAFSSSCCRALRFLTKLSAEDIKAIGADIYTDFTKADKSKIDFSKSSNEQISRISSNVSDIANHFASQVTAGDLNAYSVDVFAILHESWFRAFPEDTYAGISPEQMAVVPAERTVNITAAKIKKLSSATGNAMTPEQVSMIGSAIGAEKEVLEALSAFSFAEAAQKNYKARVEAAGNAAVSLAGASLISLAAALALLTPFL